jgi:hypothetical protein
VGGLTELQVMLARAQALAVEEGYSSRGKERVLIFQSVSLCKPEHPRWHPAGQPELVICGICHPPARDDAVWIERWAA